ncbi:MAG TPA: PH domain-containing protein, partial [Capillimicrobium sp.]|nr:PH domain-containing protein [Capillimicrobium sp.]
MSPQDGWRRLSPRMLVVQPVLELVRAIPAILGIAIIGSGSGRGGQWALAAAVLFAAIGTLRWLTTTYRITPEQVQLRRGLLRRQVLSVSRDRVRTVDVTASPLHRVVGLARVHVGTGHAGRSSDQSLTLDGLGAADAARLRGDLLHRAAAPGLEAPEAPAAAAPERELARLDPAWIRFGPFTLSGVAALALALALAARLASETDVDPEDFGILRDVVDHLTSIPTAAAIAEVAAVLLVVVALASTGGYVLSYWGFRLTRHEGGTLHVRRGLLTTRAVSIEERRLRGVELADTPLLRVAGGARCTAIATGLRRGEGSARGGSL